MRNAALIVGELCLDVSAQVSLRVEELTAVSHTDVVADGSLALTPGGTALLFANALASMTELVPLIASAVGADPAGDLLVNTLLEQDFPATGLLRAEGTRTDVVSITNFPGKGRLISRPAEKVMRKVKAWEWDRVAEMVAAYGVRFAWISGYIFEDYDTATRESMRRLFRHLHDHGIPIVVDLVPHDFAGKVGPLRQLEADLGPIDVLVGEFLTLLGLGFGQPERGGDLGPAMLGCARSAADGRAGAVVQHRGNASQYTLVTTGSPQGGHILNREIPPSGPHGLGDALAVQGLQLLGLA